MILVAVARATLCPRLPITCLPVYLSFRAQARVPRARRGQGGQPRRAWLGLGLELGLGLGLRLGLGLGLGIGLGLGLAIPIPNPNQVGDLVLLCDLASKPEMNPIPTLTLTRT